MRVDAEHNRKALIEAAWQQFSEQGPQASLRAVAAEAGVGIATLYRHFPSREELLLGVVEEVHERVLAVAAARRATWRDDPAAQWEGFVRDMVGLRVGMLIAQMSPVAAGIEAFAVRTHAMRRATLGAIDEVLAAARHEGLTREDLDAARFFGALAVISRPLPAPASEMLAADDEWLVQVFVRGLSPLH